MAWSNTKMTVVVIGVGILLVAGTVLTVIKVKAWRADQEELKTNPIAYKIQHQPPVRNVEKLRDQLVGTWILAATKRRGSTNYNYFNKDVNRYKAFTRTNFSIFSYDSDSNMVVEASGPYTLKGSNYTETLSFATNGMAQYRGAHPRFRIRIEGDKYYQMGLGKNPGIVEMWQLVPQ